jgi:hypothetical protein
MGRLSPSVVTFCAGHSRFRANRPEAKALRRFIQVDDLSLFDLTSLAGNRPVTILPLILRFIFF